MAGLLVSVRSAAEARAAWAGGATVIDVKEPARGPLGAADPSVWSAVRAALPDEATVSVALGELTEHLNGPPPDPRWFAGVAFRKMGLAGSGPGWAETWADLRRRWGAGPAWVAVVYADWERADAPRPDAVLDAALAGDCAGVLFDTWGKSRPGPLDLSWSDRVRRVQQAGRFVALAGGLDAAGIARLAPLRPDLFAVRGAACRGGRGGMVDAKRVAALIRAIGCKEGQGGGNSCNGEVPA